MTRTPEETAARLREAEALMQNWAQPTPVDNTAFGAMSMLSTIRNQAKEFLK